jgi:hypothetical protein
MPGLDPHRTPGWFPLRRCDPDCRRWRRVESSQLLYPDNSSFVLSRCKLVPGFRLSASPPPADDCNFRPKGANESGSLFALPGPKHRHPCSCRTVRVREAFFPLAKTGPARRRLSAASVPPAGRTRKRLQVKTEVLLLRILVICSAVSSCCSMGRWENGKIPARPHFFAADCGDFRFKTPVGRPSDTGK